MVRSRNRVLFAAMSVIGVNCLLGPIVPSAAASGATPVTTSAALPLVDFVPSGVAAYAGWAGTDSLAPAFARSKLKAISGQTNFTALAERYLSLILANSTDNPAQADAVSAAALIVARHPAAIYLLLPTRPGATADDATIGVLCRPGDDATELRKSFARLAVPTRSTDHAVTFWADGVAGLLSNDAVVRTGRPISSLAADKALASDLAKLGTPTSKNAVTLLIDAAAMQGAAAVAFSDSPDNTALWRGVREALNLSSIQRYVYFGGFDERNWRADEFLAAASSPDGLLAVVVPQPPDPLLLARVPSSATTIVVQNFDAAKLFDTLHAAAAVNPRWADLFGKGVGAANVSLGRNLRRQILAPLGTQWVVYRLPESHVGAEDLVSDFEDRWVVMNHLTDPHGAQDALTSVSYSASNLLNSLVKSAGASAEQIKTPDGLTVTTLHGTGLWALAWTIKDDVLIVAKTTADVTAAARSGISSPVKIPSSLAAAAAAAGISTECLQNYDYADIPTLADEHYEKLRADLTALNRLQRDDPDAWPLVRLPTLADLRPNLSPAICAAWSSGDGIHRRSLEPFPGASLLGHPSLSAAEAGSAFAASLLSPSLHQSRKLSRRMESASNERQIGLGILFYATDHDGNYPPNLGALLQVENIRPDIFVDPASGTKLPASVQSEPTSPAAAAWVDQHGDFVYQGAGLTSAGAGPNRAVVVQRKAFDGDGMNVLYGDGSVRYVPNGLTASEQSSGAIPTTAK